MTGVITITVPTGLTDPGIEVLQCLPGCKCMMNYCNRPVVSKIGVYPFESAAIRDGRILDGNPRKINASKMIDRCQASREFGAQDGTLPADPKEARKRMGIVVWSDLSHLNGLF